MRKEITIPIDLDEAEERLLDRHSILNLLNILHLEIDKLSEDSGFEPLQPYRFIMIDIIKALAEPSIEQKLTAFTDHIKNLVPVLKELEEQFPVYVKSVQSILTIIEVAFVRAEEFQSKRMEWQAIPADSFREKLLQFFDATQMVSRNRFHFTYPPEAKATDAYLIEILLELDDEQVVFAPPVIHDIIRDLAANSRKYSPPGTRIEIRLTQSSDKSLCLKISDEGIGIPEEDLENVVKFSTRGSNVTYKPTMGNGFGLTKAYQITKIFNGSFTIESELNIGTTIELSIYPVLHSVSV